MNSAVSTGIPYFLFWFVPHDQRSTDQNVSFIHFHLLPFCSIKNIHRINVVYSTLTYSLLITAVSISVTQPTSFSVCYLRAEPHFHLCHIMNSFELNSIWLTLLSSYSGNFTLINSFYVKLTSFSFWPLLAFQVQIKQHRNHLRTRKFCNR